jgi:hypothetical protein
MRDDGRSWPSQTTLCADLVASDRAIRKWAAELEVAGFLLRVGGHPGRQVEYRHLIPADLPSRTLDRLSRASDSSAGNHRKTNRAEINNRNPRSDDSGTGEPLDRHSDATQTLTESSSLEPSTRLAASIPQSAPPSNGEGSDDAPIPDADLAIEAEKFMVMVVSHLPPHVQERFQSDWAALELIDPKLWVKAQHAIVAVIGRQNDRANRLLYNRMLTPDEHDTWATARDIAKVMLSRLHAARREVDGWYF